MNFFRFNKLYIIESLGDERHTGEELYNDVVKILGGINGVQTEFKEIVTADQWYTLMAEIRRRVVEDKEMPILHLEIHGSDKHDGFVTTSRELLPWAKLVEEFRSINIATHNNFFVTMGICNAMEILYFTSLEKESPFFAAIGSLHELINDDIYIRFSEFYNEFLRSFDITVSLNALFKANNDVDNRLSFVNAPELFKIVYSGYLKTQFTEEAIKERIDYSLPLYESRFGRKLKEDEVADFSSAFKDLLLSTKEEIYTENINHFLMTDRFEDCKNRFKIPQTTDEFMRYDWKNVIPNVLV